MWQVREWFQVFFSLEVFGLPVGAAVDAGARRPTPLIGRRDVAPVVVDRLERKSLSVPIGLLYRARASKMYLRVRIGAPSGRVRSPSAPAVDGGQRPGAVTLLLRRPRVRHAANLHLKGER